MLLVYLEPLIIAQTELLNLWRPGVSYWPRSWASTDSFNSAIPTDWWLLFSNPMYADMWLLKYSDHTRVVRTLFDE